MIFFSMGGCTLGKFNSMGGGHMNLSEYMGGRGLWKYNSMGGGVEKKVPSSPPQVFFSGIALRGRPKYLHNAVNFQSDFPNLIDLRDIFPKVKGPRPQVLKGRKIPDST